MRDCRPEGPSLSIAETPFHEKKGASCGGHPGDFGVGHGPRSRPRSRRRSDRPVGRPRRVAPQRVESSLAAGFEGPGGHLHGLVPRGRPKRVAGQNRAGPPARAHDVQGHKALRREGLFQHRSAQRRPAQRIHQPGLHRLLRAHRRRPCGSRHRAGSRPHEEPPAGPQRVPARAQRRPGGAQAEGGRQPHTSGAPPTRRTLTARR